MVSRRTRPLTPGAAIAALLLTACGPGRVTLQPAQLEPQAEAPIPGSIDLLTYNVAGLPRWVGKFDGRETHPKIGAGLGPFELVLLQEDFWYHQRLSAPHPWQGPPRSGGFLRLGDGLARMSAYPLSSVEHVPWKTAHGLFGAYHDRWAWKGFAAGTLDLGGSLQIWVYNVHFDAGGSKGDRKAREVQRDQLRQDILTRTALDDAVIVAGDFNCGSSALKDFAAAAHLKDAGGGGIDRVFYRSGSHLELTPDQTIDPAHEPPSLDALRGLSDHAPVWRRFGLRRR